MNIDLSIIWFVIIVFATLMYIVMDGFDLGIGILFPFTRSAQERDVMVNSVAPGWDGNRRTLLLGDGSKLTMNATGPHGLVLETSIYDGGRELHLSNPTNTVVFHGTDPVGARCRDATQHDGETASFSTDAGSGVAIYRNAYNEDAAYNRVDSNVPLGTTGGFANPNQVNDLFDDPRLGHT